MLERIKKWFGIKSNDWKLVWTEFGYTEMYWSREKYDTKYCYYYIYFSSSRNRYKLKTSGYRAKQHRMYAAVLEKLIQYENTLSN